MIFYLTDHSQPSILHRTQISWCVAKPIDVGMAKHIHVPDTNSV